MRVLKIAAIIMVSIVLAMALMLGYLFMTAEVTVVSVTSSGLNASQKNAEFEALKTSLDEETFMGTLFSKPEQWKNAEDYAFLQFQVRLRNGCLVPIDMVEIQVVPQPTDILQLGDRQMHSLQPKQEGNFSAAILAPKDTHPVREIIVTYYVWGVSFQLHTMSGGAN